jgi:hypothetical protein
MPGNGAISEKIREKFSRDSFPVRKTASPSPGHQQIVCPKCGHDFDITMEETVERLSPVLKFKLAVAR